ncbi:MAG: hypothetical protein ACKOZY_10995, partial [Flavobacteriales bacterium]
GTVAFNPAKRFALVLGYDGQNVTFVDVRETNQIDKSQGNYTLKVRQERVGSQKELTQLLF